MKLSPHLKALINAPHSLPSAIPSPGRGALNGILDKITSRGSKYGIDHRAWLTLGTAALVTLNSPESVSGLWEYATRAKGVDGVEAATVRLPRSLDPNARRIYVKRGEEKRGREEERGPS